MSRARKTFSDKIAQQLKSGVTNLALYGTETAQALDLQAMTVGTITRKIKRDIESMRQTANYFSSYSFASNQIGLDYRIFLISKNLKDGKWLNPRKEKEIKYDVIINPEITEISSVYILQKSICIIIS
jgi:peptide deformylase